MRLLSKPQPTPSTQTVEDDGPCRHRTTNQTQVQVTIANNGRPMTVTVTRVVCTDQCGAEL